MQKLRLGVIGTGMAWERLHWPAIQELRDRYEVAAVCNRTKQDAENFANSINLGTDNVYQDYRELLERDDLDAVDVLVPIQDNYEIAEAVIESGKNLIAEKPLAATLEGAKKLVDLSHKRPVKVMVAENYRYNEENNIIKEIISQGKIGDVIYFIQNNMVNFKEEMKGDTFAATEWRQYPNYRGGTFLDAGIHDIAALRHIFGEVDRVCALGQPQQEPFNPYKSINAQVLFKSGIIGQYNYSSHGQELQKPMVGFRIYGTQGEIYLEEKTSGTIYVNYADGNSEEISYKPGRGYYNELMNFYDSLTGNQQILATPEKGFGDLKMVFDILSSIEAKQPVQVDMVH